MSKIISVRYEAVCYNDATLSSTPPTYPPPLDVYQAGYVGTAADAYGIMPVTSTAGTAVALGIPAGATCIVIGDPANTAPITLTQTSVPKVPNATGTALNWSVQPNQIVTLPGVLNLGAISVQGTTTAGVATTNVAFAAIILWSL